MARLAHGHACTRAWHRPGCCPLHSTTHATHRNRPTRSVRCLAVSDDDSDVDPQTGELYSNPQTRYSKPDSSIEADGLTWAYRTATPPDGVNTEGKLPVLLLHGIGSHSYCYRDLSRLLAGKGHTVYAPDWPGHGASSKPESGFAYDEEAFIDALTAFTKAVGLSGQPYAVATSGFILGQYGLLWALTQKEDIACLIMLGVPLGQKTPLRPELAAYKSRLPFRRPKPDSKFGADYFNANGLAYVMAGVDAQEEPAANKAIHSIMEKVKWEQLLKTLDERYETWRTPTMILYGNKDGLLDVKEASQWLETKRTNIKLNNVEGKLGHMPQEDFADAIAPLITDFLSGQAQALEGFKRFKKTDYYGAPETESKTGNYAERS